MCPMMSNYTSWGCELLRLQHGQKALRITGFLWSLCGRQHGATQQFGALRYTCHIYIYILIYIYIYHVYSSLSKIPAPKGVWFGLYIPASSSHDKLMPASKYPKKKMIQSILDMCSTSPKDRHVFFYNIFHGPFYLPPPNFQIHPAVRTGLEDWTVGQWSNC